MLVKAVAKGVRVSPRKVSVVASLVRGRSVEDALIILSHTPRNAALSVRKTIESAKSNADHNHNLVPASLRILEIGVSPGQRLKRMRLGARGRALPYQRKTSHIRVVVEGEPRQVKKPANVKKPNSSKETK